ncbi:MAG TPA: hypothetical protein VHR84_11080 [Terriglobales bacterium]|nr:hypothetical protein [Terriglobales bacterium]
MHWFISIVGGIVVGLAWLAIWALLLRAFGIVAFSIQAEESVRRRERIKQMGKFRYILIFGVAGYGLMFGLAMTVAGVLDHDSPGVGFSIVKLLFLSVLVGCFHGVRTWNQAFRDPVPFPPAYPPQK